MTGIKVINPAFGRTGTHSFKKAMEILGYGKCYHMEEVFDNCMCTEWLKYSVSRDPNIMRDILEKNGYHSTCDMPTSLYWQEQLLLYPDAKLVLTTRDPEKWYDSWVNTIHYMQIDSEQCPFGVRVAHGMGFNNMKNAGAMMHNVITRDAFNKDLSKQNMIKCYLEHIENVKKLCPPEKLLLFNASDGWEPLCKFLNVPIPDVPYPSLSSTIEFQRVVTFINCVGWLFTIFFLGIPAFFRLKSSITEDVKKSNNLTYVKIEQ